VADDARKKSQGEKTPDHHHASDDPTQSGHRRDVTEADSGDRDQRPPEPVPEVAHLRVHGAFDQEKTDSAQDRLHAEDGKRKGEQESIFLERVHEPLEGIGVSKEAPRSQQPQETQRAQTTKSRH